MKRIHILVLLLASLLLFGCKAASYKDITVTSFRVISIVPEGLSDLSALVEVGVHNPAPAFELSGLEGLARYRGQDAFTITADQLIIAGREDKLYRIPVKGHIAEGFNPFQLLKLISSEASPDDVTFDVKGKVALRGGLGKNIELKDIPLSSLLNGPQSTVTNEE